eukprot:EG_transcript_25515
MADVERGLSPSVHSVHPRLPGRAFSAHHRWQGDADNGPVQARRRRWMTCPVTFTWPGWPLPRGPYSACFCGVLLSFVLLVIQNVFKHGAGPNGSHDGPCKCRDPAASTVPVVVSWVNVSDPSWQALAKRHGCDVDQYLAGEGDVDPFDSLRYLLRSIATHAPFLSPIILTTERNQIPSWLNTSRPDVRVVFHDEYVPAAPVFNSHPFEYRLGHFPEIDVTTDGHTTNSSLFGSCFVYMNDDFLLNS